MSFCILKFMYMSYSLLFNIETGVTCIFLAKRSQLFIFYYVILLLCFHFTKYAKYSASMINISIDQNIYGIRALQ